MSTRNDEIAVVLIARQQLYRLFQRVFGSEPDGAMLEALVDQGTREVFGLFLDEGDACVLALESTLAGIARELSVSKQNLLDDLSDEFTRLFIGPLQLPAPPWESIYVTEERALFQACTLKVRKAYLKHRFLPANYPHDADDHLAIELDFMAHLAQDTIELFDAADYAAAEQLLLDQKSFLDEHLLVWIDAFVEAIEGSETQLLYPQMARVAMRFLKNDAIAIEELLPVMRGNPYE